MKKHYRITLSPEPARSWNAQSHVIHILARSPRQALAEIPMQSLQHDQKLTMTIEQIDSPIMESVRSSDYYP